MADLIQFPLPLFTPCHSVVPRTVFYEGDSLHMYEIVYFQTSEQVTRVSTDPSFFSLKQRRRR